MPQSSLYELVEWVKREGAVKSVSRLQVKLAPLAIREKVLFHRIAPDTACSDALFTAARKAATDIVGKPCPF